MIVISVGTNESRSSVAVKTHIYRIITSYYLWSSSLIVSAEFTFEAYARIKNTYDKNCKKISERKYRFSQHFVSLNFVKLLPFQMKLV